MKEIKIGFLRGIGYMLSSVVVGGIVGFLIWIIFFNGVLFKKECVSWNYRNGEKVCAKYKYK